MTPQRNKPSILLRIIASSVFGIPNRKNMAALLALGLAFAFGLSARAATSTWSGAADGTWADPGNWSTLPVNGASLVFTGATGSGGTMLTDDLMTPATYSLDGITFNSDAAAFIVNPAVGGTNGFTLAASSAIANNSINVETINDPITFDGAETFSSTVAGGSLVLGGTLGVGGNNVTFTGPGNITVSNAQNFNPTGGYNSAATVMTINGGATVTMDSQTAGQTKVIRNLVISGSSTLTSDVGDGFSLQMGNGDYSGGGDAVQIGGGSSITGALTLDEISAHAETLIHVTGGSGTATVSANLGLDIGSGRDSTLNVDTHLTGNFSGTISNAGGYTPGLVLEGNGTIILSGNNTFGGSKNVTDSVGDLVINNANALGASSNTWIIGAGTSFDNTNGGLTLTSYKQTWNGSFTFIGTNALNLGSGAVTLAASPTITVASPTNALTVGGVISGAFGITEAGPGTLMLGGANTFTGNTLVSSGTLALSNNLALQDSPLDTSGAGSLSLSVTTPTFGGLINSGNLATIIASGYSSVTGITLNLASGVNDNYSGVISNGAANMSLTKIGVGSQTLSGANTYTGATTISSGTLAAGVASVAGISGAFGNNSAVTLANTAGATLNITGYNTQIGSLAGGGTTGGGVTLGAATLTLGGASIATNYAGVIAGTGGLTMNATGTQTLSGANTFNGNTLVSAGTLALSNNLALQDSTLDTSGAGSLSLSVTTPTFGGLINGGNLASVITSGYGSVTTLTLNPGSGVVDSYSGVIANGAASMNLTKSGSGEQILTGSNTYTGTTTVTTGTLGVSGAGTLGAGGSAALTVNGGTVDLGTTTQTVGAVSITAASSGNSIQNGTLTGSSFAASNTTGNAIVTANLAGTGIALTKTGAGTLTLKGANTYTGATTVSAGILNIQSNGGLGASSGVTVSSGAALQLQGGISTTNAVPLSIVGTGVGSKGAIENVSGNNTYSAAVTLASTAATYVGSDSGTMSMTGAFALGGNGTQNNVTFTGTGTVVLANVTVAVGSTYGTNNANVTVSGGGILNLDNGSGSIQISALTVSGSSTVGADAGHTGLQLIMDDDGPGANQSIGTKPGITIYAGSTIGNGISLETNSAHTETDFDVMGSGTATIAANFANAKGSNADGVIDAFSGATGNFTGVLSQSGYTSGMQLYGPGTIIFAGANTFGGSGNVFNLEAGGGTFDINNASAMGNAADKFTINSGWTIDNTSGASITTSNYPQTWNSNFTFGGTNPLNLGSGAVTMAGSTQITTSGTSPLTVNGVIGGTGFGLAKAGPGTLVLGGANTYTGTTTVNAGTLQLGSGGSLGGTAVTVGSTTNATLFISGNYAVGTAGTSNLTLTGTTGTLSLADGTINTLTIEGAASALTLGGSDTISMEVSGGAADEILLAGTGKVASVTGTNTIDLTYLTSFTSGTDVLISAASGLATSGTFVLGPATGTLTLGTSTLVDSSTAVLLVNVANATPSTAYYTGTLGSSWNSTSGSGTNGQANFTSDSAGANNTNQVPGAITNVHFYTTNATTGNLASTLGQNFIINSLTIDGTSVGGESNPVSIGGANSLTIVASGTNGITVGAGAGAVTVSAPLILGTSQSWANNSTNAFSVSGPISGAYALSTTGTGTIVLSGNNSYNGGTNIQNGTLQVNTGGTLGSTSAAVTMGTGVAGTIGTVGNLTMNTSGTIGALTVQSNTSDTTTSANIGQLSIASGKTLVASSFSAGLINTAASNTTNTALATGAAGTGGTLTVNGNFFTGANSTSSGNLASDTVVNLSGLSQFNQTATSGTLAVGYGENDNAALTLAANNTIQAGTITVADSVAGANYNAAYSVLNLGTGNNVLDATNIIIGQNKGSGILQFGSGNTTGTVTIAGVTGGASTATITLANSQTLVTTYGPATNNTELLLAGHNATVQAGVLTVADESANITNNAPNASVTFDTGTFNATTIQMALSVNGATDSSAEIATFTVGGPTANSAATGVLTDSGNFILAGNTASNKANGVSTGSLIINGGTVNIGSGATNGIFDTTTNTNASGGSATTLTLAGGTLNLNGGVIGGTTVGVGKKNIGTLNFQSGTLENVASINGTAGLTKTTSGTLTLAGANGYTGATTISAGTLDIASASAVGTAQPLGENSTVSLGAATLAYLGTTGTLAQNVTLTGNGTISNTGGSTLTLSGTLTKQGDVLSLSGGAFNVTGPITGNSGSFNSDLDVVNQAFVTLSNAGNNYYGPTVVSGSSTLQNGVANALPASTILTLGAGGDAGTAVNTYDLNGAGQSIAGLASAGTGSQLVTDSAASTASTLTITGTTSTETYGGVIQNGKGNVALTVSGGSEVLNGANTYSGNTSVTGGTLTIGATGALTSSTNVSVSNGGTFAVNSGGSILSTTALVANGNVNLNNAAQSLARLNGASTGVMTLNSTSLTVNNGGTFAGVIQDGARAGSLTVAGGTLALTGDNTFSGGATVSGGTLLVSGSLSGAGAVNVAGGALGGSGYIAGATTVGEAGTLAPAATLTGTAGIVLTIGNNVALNDGSALVINIDANTNATDLLQITNGGALTLAGNDTLTVDLVNGSSLANPLSGYEIASYTGMLSGVFANVNIPAGYVVDYGVTVANEITLQAQAIPEPGAWAMLLCGAGMLLVRKRKRRQLN